MNLLDATLTPNERSELERLLRLIGKQVPELTQEDVWRMMDIIWDEMNCDNRNPGEESLNRYYQHPVWLFSGLYIENDPLSLSFREAVSRTIAEKRGRKVLDYGGGFGTLARIIATGNPEAHVEVYDPCPSELARQRAIEYKNVGYVSEIKERYDTLVCTDVLEHVPDPLLLLRQMLKSLEVDGHLMIGNCFEPVIKCHLPRTFHFRYSFRRIAKQMGLEYLGPCEDTYILQFRKTKEEFSWSRVRRFETYSKILFPFLRVFYPVAAGLWRSLRRVIRKPKVSPVS